MTKYTMSDNAMERVDVPPHDTPAHDRDPEDIVVHEDRWGKQANPCYLCGMVANDVVSTNRYLWHVCSRCAELTVTFICAARHTMRGEKRWFRKLKQECLKIQPLIPKG